jgi:hypothetical protein
MPTSFRKQDGVIVIGAAIIVAGGIVAGGIIVAGIIAVGVIIAIGATAIAGGHGAAAIAVGVGNSALPAQNLPRVKQGSSVASQLTQDFQGAG